MFANWSSSPRERPAASMARRLGAGAALVLLGSRVSAAPPKPKSPPYQLRFRGAPTVSSRTLHGARATWAKAHETMFQTVMQSLDRYVNAEEFRSLKSQSLMLREKKVF